MTQAALNLAANTLQINQPMQPMNREGWKMSIYIPECLRGLPRPPPGRKAKSNLKKQNRDMAQMAIIECIQRVKAAQRSAPKEWDRGYNSAITKLELFLGEVSEKSWPPSEL